MKTPGRLMAFVVVMSTCDASAQTAVPAEMDRLRTAYEVARKQATRPVDEKYLTELIGLQDSLTKAARLQEAMAVANEVHRIRELLRMPVDPKAPAKVASVKPMNGATKTAAVADGSDGKIVIPANDPNGYRLGAVKRGETIVLQYASGRWKSHGKLATESPDDPKGRYGDDDRLVIAEAADADGAPGKIIKTVPPDTVLAPFTYVMQTSSNDVVLRIHSNSQRKDNPGKVSYTMKLVR